MGIRRGHAQNQEELSFFFLKKQVEKMEKLEAKIAVYSCS